MRDRKKGMALLMTIAILLMLYLIAIVYVTPSRLAHQISLMTRHPVEANLYARMGLHRAMAELLYDVWGVGETTAFNYRLTEAVDGAKSAYFHGYDSVTGQYTAPIEEPNAYWHFDLKLGANSNSSYVAAGGDPVSYGYAAGTEGVVWERNPGVWRNRNDGAPLDWHDSFLPGHTDNNPMWEYRVFHNRVKNGAATAATAATNVHWISTRLQGDSFYRIFRNETIDIEKTAMTARQYWTLINQRNHVNTNEDAEFFYPATLTRVPDLVDQDAATGDPAKRGRIGINDAKWIYIPDPETWNEAIGKFTRHHGRYAVSIWPDCGTLNVNMLAAQAQKGASFSPPVGHTDDEGNSLPPEEQWRHNRTQSWYRFDLAQATQITHQGVDPKFQPPWWPTTEIKNWNMIYNWNEEKGFCTAYYMRGLDIGFDGTAAAGVVSGGRGRMYHPYKNFLPEAGSSLLDCDALYHMTLIGQAPFDPRWELTDYQQMFSQQHGASAESHPGGDAYTPTIVHFFGQTSYRWDENMTGGAADFHKRCYPGGWWLDTVTHGGATSLAGVAKGIRYKHLGMAPSFYGFFTSRVDMNYYIRKNMFNAFAKSTWPVLVLEPNPGGYTADSSGTDYSNRTSPSGIVEMVICAPGADYTDPVSGGTATASADPGQMQAGDLPGGFTMPGTTKVISRRESAGTTETGRITLDDIQNAATRLTYMFSPHSYTYVLNPHWNFDRFIVSGGQWITPLSMFDNPQAHDPTQPIKRMDLRGGGGPSETDYYVLWGLQRHLWGKDINDSVGGINFAAPIVADQQGIQYLYTRTAANEDWEITKASDPKVGNCGLTDISGATWHNKMSQVRAGCVIIANILTANSQCSGSTGNAYRYRTGYSFMGYLQRWNSTPSSMVVNQDIKYGSISANGQSCGQMDVYGLAGVDQEDADGMSRTPGAKGNIRNRPLVNEISIDGDGRIKYVELVWPWRLVDKFEWSYWDRRDIRHHPGQYQKWNDVGPGGANEAKAIFPTDAGPHHGSCDPRIDQEGITYYITNDGGAGKGGHDWSLLAKGFAGEPIPTFEDRYGSFPTKGGFDARSSQAMFIQTSDWRGATQSTFMLDTLRFNAAVGVTRSRDDLLGNRGGFNDFQDEMTGVVTGTLELDFPDTVKQCWSFYTKEYWKLKKGMLIHMNDELMLCTMVGSDYGPHRFRNYGGDGIVWEPAREYHTWVNSPQTNTDPTNAWWAGYMSSQTNSGHRIQVLRAVYGSTRQSHSRGDKWRAFFPLGRVKSAGAGQVELCPAERSWQIKQGGSSLLGRSGCNWVADGDNQVWRNHFTDIFNFEPGMIVRGIDCGPSATWDTGDLSGFWMVGDSFDYRLTTAYGANGNGGATNSNPMLTDGLSSTCLQAMWTDRSYESKTPAAAYLSDDPNNFDNMDGPTMSLVDPRLEGSSPGPFNDGDFVIGITTPNPMLHRALYFDYFDENGEAVAREWGDTWDFGYPMRPFGNNNDWGHWDASYPSGGWQKQPCARARLVPYRPGDTNPINGVGGDHSSHGGGGGDVIYSSTESTILRIEAYNPQSTFPRTDSQKPAYPDAQPGRPCRGLFAFISNGQGTATNYLNGYGLTASGGAFWYNTAYLFLRTGHAMPERFVVAAWLPDTGSDTQGVIALAKGPHTPRKIAGALDGSTPGSMWAAFKNPQPGHPFVWRHGHAFYGDYSWDDPADAGYPGGLSKTDNINMYGSSPSMHNNYCDPNIVIKQDCEVDGTPSATDSSGRYKSWWIYFYQTGNSATDGACHHYKWTSAYYIGMWPYEDGLWQPEEPVISYGFDATWDTTAANSFGKKFRRRRWTIEDAGFTHNPALELYMQDYMSPTNINRPDVFSEQGDPRAENRNPYYQRVRSALDVDDPDWIPAYTYWNTLSLAGRLSIFTARGINTVERRRRALINITFDINNRVWVASPKPKALGGSRDGDNTKGTYYIPYKPGAAAYHMGFHVPNNYDYDQIPDLHYLGTHNTQVISRQVYPNIKGWDASVTLNSAQGIGVGLGRNTYSFASYGHMPYYQDRLYTNRQINELHGTNPSIGDICDATTGHPSRPAVAKHYRKYVPGVSYPQELSGHVLYMTAGQNFKCGVAVAESTQWNYAGAITSIGDLGSGVVHEHLTNNGICDGADNMRQGSLVGDWQYAEAGEWRYRVPPNFNMHRMRQLLDGGEAANDRTLIAGPAYPNPQGGGGYLANTSAIDYGPNAEDHHAKYPDKPGQYPFYHHIWKKPRSVYEDGSGDGGLAATHVLGTCPVSGYNFRGDEWNIKGAASERLMLNNHQVVTIGRITRGAQYPRRASIGGGNYGWNYYNGSNNLFCLQPWDSAHLGMYPMTGGDQRRFLKADRNFSCVNPLLNHARTQWIPHLVENGANHDSLVTPLLLGNSPSSLDNNCYNDAVLGTAAQRAAGGVFAVINRADTPGRPNWCDPYSGLSGNASTDQSIFYLMDEQFEDGSSGSKGALTRFWMFNTFLGRQGGMQKHNTYVQGPRPGHDIMKSRHDFRFIPTGFMPNRSSGSASELWDHALWQQVANSSADRMNAWKTNLWYYMNTTDFLENIDHAPDPNLSDRKSALFDNKDNDMDGIYHEYNWIGGYYYAHMGKGYTWLPITSRASASNVCTERYHSTAQAQASGFLPGGLTFPGYIDLVGTATMGAAPSHKMGNDNRHRYGHYLIEYQTTNRFNINDTPWPFTLQQYYQDEWVYENQILVTGQKPVLGYLTVANVEGRMCFKVDNDGTTRDMNNDTPPSPWTPGATARVRNAWASQWTDNIEWVHNSTWGGNYWDYYEIKSPVYTIFVVGQSIREGADRIQPLSEVRITATVERTFDGRINVLEYRVGNRSVYD